MPKTDMTLDRITDLLARAKKAGADDADAVYVEGTSLSVSQRLGKMEKLERSEGADLGLRVLIGKQQAVVSSSDTSESALNELVERAVAMAKNAPEDPFCGIADPSELAETFDVEALELCEPGEVSQEKLMAWATACEEAARSVEGITNSEGADAGWGTHQITLAATNGFAIPMPAAAATFPYRPLPEPAPGWNAIMIMTVRCFRPICAIRSRLA